MSIHDALNFWVAKIIADILMFLIALVLIVAGGIIFYTLSGKK